MKIKILKSIILVSILSLLILIPNSGQNGEFGSSVLIIGNSYKEDIVSTVVFDATEIDDTPGSLNNWSWAKSQGICNGSGTELDPYVIEGQIFHPTSNWDCLRIIHSRKHFTIENCEFRYAPSIYSGLFIANATKGTIINNEFHGNKYGIYALEMNDTLISGNHFHSNLGDGLLIDTGYRNIISNNNLSSNGWQGMWMENSGNNQLSGNLAGNNNFSGIYLDECDQNTISNNNLKGNLLAGLSVNGNTYALVEDNVFEMNGHEGIYFNDNIYSNITGNTIENNGQIGILVYNTISSLISENIINNNSITGISIDENCYENMIFLNCFNNSLNAQDNGTNTHWDNQIYGNYWSDYTGLDTDSDGVGNSPYNITGSAGSKDNFPLMECSPHLQPTQGVIYGYNLLIIAISFSIVLTWFLRHKNITRQKRTYIGK